MSEHYLGRITAPHFVAGLEVDHETWRVCKAAPIIGYMLDWPSRRVAEYCARKCWLIERVDAVADKEEPFH